MRISTEIILRLGVIFVYCYAAYLNINNKDSWKWTYTNTGLLFYKIQVNVPVCLLKILAAAGVAFMFIGSAFLLVDSLVRIGASMLFIFTLLGMLVHYNSSSLAINQLKEIDKSLDEKNRSVVSELAWSAYSGHFSSALKNVTLLAIQLYFIVVG